MTICISLFLFSCNEDDLINPQKNSDALLKSKTLYYSLTQTTTPLITEYQYDSSGNLIKESDFEGEDKHLARYFAFEYNDNRQVILKNYFSEDFENNDYRIIVKYEYDYSGEQLNSMNKYRKKANTENEFYIHETHSYNYGSGRLLEENIDYEETGSQTKYEYQYDDRGNITKRTEYLFYSDDIFDYRWKYDENNNKIEEKRYCNNEEQVKIIFDYSGTQLDKESTINDGNIVREITYLYDDNGNLIQEKKVVKNPLSNEMPELIIYEYY
ncbi:MAG: hypothetical protein JXB24_07495 [Bacteroidales bacterium]|nr:hypothetical protein [Bacteroidales bacterium]